jgi:hypothetical protein
MHSDRTSRANAKGSTALDGLFALDTTDEIRDLGFAAFASEATVVTARGRKAHGQPRCLAASTRPC